MKILSTFILIFAAALSAQVPLKVVLPESDTTKYSYPKHRVAGSTSPDARVFINGAEVKVNALGAFIGMAEIPEGTSQIRFVARAANGDSAVKLMTVIRPKRAEATPRDPLTIEKTMMLPAGNVMHRTTRYCSKGLYEIQGAKKGKKKGRDKSRPTHQ